MAKNTLNTIVGTLTIAAILTSISAISIIGKTVYNVNATLNKMQIYKPLEVSKIKNPTTKETTTTIKKPYKELNWKEAIQQISSPKEAQEYLDTYISYDYETVKKGTNDSIHSFEINYNDKKMICSEYANAAAALLEDDGYTPNALYLCYSNSLDGHAMYIYKKSAGFGAIGNTPLEAKYKNIPELVRGFNKKYHKTYNKYMLVDLNETYPNHMWVEGDKKLNNELSNINCYVKMFGKIWYVSENDIQTL